MLESSATEKYKFD